MAEQKKVITRGNIGKCIWDTASEEAKKKMLDTYNEMVKHGFVITVMPSADSCHKVKDTRTAVTTLELDDE